MICCDIIFGSLIFNLFLHTYDDILYPKCLLCMYVFPEVCPRTPKHVVEIIMKESLHEYLQLVGINTM